MREVGGAASKVWADARQVMAVKKTDKGRGQKGRRYRTDGQTDGQTGKRATVKTEADYRTRATNQAHGQQEAHGQKLPRATREPVTAHGEQ